MSDQDSSSRKLGCDSFTHIAAYPYRKTLCGQVADEGAVDVPAETADCAVCRAIDAELEARADEVMAVA